MSYYASKTELSQLGSSTSLKSYPQLEIKGGASEREDQGTRQRRWAARGDAEDATGGLESALGMVLVFPGL